MYMPGDHDHAAWKKKRNERNNGNFDERRAKRKKTKSPESSGDKSKTPSKLQLSKSIRSALVTTFKMTSSDADQVFKEAYDDAASLKE